MKAGLVDMVLGRFGDGTPVAGVTGDELRLRSVIGNLTHLFNTRQGSLQHLADYGLPDLASLYRGMPDSAEDLRKHIQKAVEKFEPRLNRVRVRAQPTESTSMRLSLMVTGELNGQRVRLQTTFSSNDPVTVDAYTRRD